MKNERMYNELIELLTTDSAAGKENAIADKLTEKMEALGFTVTRDNAGETFGGECGNGYERCSKNCREHDARKAHCK